MIGVRLDKEMERQLEDLANQTHRSKSFYVREALKLYLEELQDYELALSRLHNPRDKVISSRDMWKRLGLNVQSNL